MPRDRHLMPLDRHLQPSASFATDCWSETCSEDCKWWSRDCRMLQKSASCQAPELQSRDCGNSAMATTSRTRHVSSFSTTGTSCYEPRTTWDTPSFYLLEWSLCILCMVAGLILPQPRVWSARGKIHIITAKPVSVKAFLTFTVSRICFLLSLK